MKWLIPWIAWFNTYGHTADKYLEDYKDFLTVNEISASPLDSFAGFEIHFDLFMLRHDFIALTFRRGGYHHIMLRPDVLTDTSLARLVIFHELSHVMGIGTYCNKQTKHPCIKCNRIMRAQITPDFVEYSKHNWPALTRMLANKIKRCAPRN